MQITEEQIKRLMRYAGVSEPEARWALEQADGDLLNALELLSQRKQPEDTEPTTTGSGSFGEFLRWLWHLLVENRLEAYLPGTERSIECPLAALLLLLVLAWYAVLFFVVLGICFGWRFHFVGPQLGKDSVNQVVSDLDDAAETLRDTLKQVLRRCIADYQKHKNEKKDR